QSNGRTQVSRVQSLTPLATAAARSALGCTPRLRRLPVRMARSTPRASRYLSFTHAGSPAGCALGLASLAGGSGASPNDAPTFQNPCRASGGPPPRSRQRSPAGTNGATCPQSTIWWGTSTANARSPLGSFPPAPLIPRATIGSPDCWAHGVREGGRKRRGHGDCAEITEEKPICLLVSLWSRCLLRDLCVSVPPFH